MDEDEITGGIMTLMAGALIGVLLGHFLWASTKIVQVPVFGNGDVKKCLEDGGEFYASQLDRPQCKYPERTIYIMPATNSNL